MSITFLYPLHNEWYCCNAKAYNPLISPMCANLTHGGTHHGVFIPNLYQAIEKRSQPFSSKTSVFLKA